MRLATTLRLTPAPSMKGILSAAVMLYVFIFAQRFRPMAFGVHLDPVSLAVATRILLQLVENSARWPRLFRTFNRYRGPVAATLAVPFLGVGLMLWINAPHAAQALWSAIMALAGTAGLILVAFGKPSMKYIPSGFPKTHATARPIHLFLSMSLILQAVFAALLARHGTELAWITYASAGWVVQFWLTNWLAMLWLIAHEQDNA